jgi:hypothetical protein
MTAMTPIVHIQGFKVCFEINLNIYTKAAAAVQFREAEVELSKVQCCFAFCEKGCAGWVCGAGHGLCEEHMNDMHGAFLADGSDACTYRCPRTQTPCKEFITAEEADKSMSRWGCTV